MKSLSFSNKLLSAFANLIGLFITISLIGTVLSDAVPANAQLFEVVGRFSIFVALLSCILAALGTQVKPPATQQIQYRGGQQKSIIVLSGFVGFITVIGVSMSNNNFGILEFLIALITAFCTALLTVTVLIPFNPTTVSTEKSLSTLKIYGLLALLFFLSSLGRIVIPASVITTTILAPLNFCIIPGLSLCIAFLPDTSWYEKLAYSLPVSITVQLIAWLWIDQLHIKMYIPTFFLVAAIITIVGFIFARRSVGQPD